METDNYLTWNHELKDSTQEVNQYIKEQIEAALEISNNRRYVQSCKRVTLEIAKRFMTLPPVHLPFEHWIDANLDSSHVYPKMQQIQYFDQSIYQNPTMFYLRFVPLSPNIQVNGIYFGLDKLSHFLSSGRRHFLNYSRRIRRGWSEEEALKHSVRKGLIDEARFLGLAASGVFSYADVEANFQGLIFYKKICTDESETFLSQNDDGTWSLTNIPEIRDFVSPHWDETFNISYREKNTWNKTFPVIKELYCPLVNSEIVSKRMAFYNQFKFESFSLNYVKELQVDEYKYAPNPRTEQSLRELCGVESLVP